MKLHKLLIALSFVLVACLGIVFGIGLYLPSPQSEFPEVATSDQPVLTLSDYPVYDNVSSLTSAATLTVEGKVLSLQQNVAINISPNQKRDTIIEYTVLQVEIIEVYDGTATVGTIIPVKYPPDAANTWPEFTVGTEGIFVLQTYESTPASMLNPSQSFYDFSAGTYWIDNENDLIGKALSDIGFNSATASKTGAYTVPADDVRTLFRSVAKTT